MRGIGNIENEQLTEIVERISIVAGGSILQRLKLFKRRAPISSETLSVAWAYQN